MSAPPPFTAPVSAGAVPALQVQGLSHQFGKARALRDVSFTVEQGAFCALLGVNGAGKTTLVSLISRLYNSASGYIGVGGHDLRRQPEAALAKLGVVFQSRALDGDLSLRQNLAYHGALHGLSPRQAHARTLEVLELVDLRAKAEARAATLSGGQQRRAEIARALLHKPRLLILDEATAGLDLSARAAVLALTRRLVAEEKVSVLWATHIFEELAPQDRAVVLHHGRILADARCGQIAGETTLAQAFLTLTGGAGPAQDLSPPRPKEPVS